MIPAEYIASLLFVIVGIITFYLIVKRAEHKQDRDENNSLFK
jgi:hypothetical protein